MWKEVDNDLGQFVLSLFSEAAFECNLLIVVVTVGNTRSTVPVNSVACF